MATREDSELMWHQCDAKTALTKLESDAGQGLSRKVAADRLQQFGPNVLVQSFSRGPWRILWEQLSGAMVVLLFVAMAVSAILAEYTDAAVIAAIIVLNAALGFFQDFRAERALAALKKLAVPIVRVRRDAETAEISASELVVGDVVLLETGNYVPADCRLLQSINLRIEEAVLTGESHASEKQTQSLSSDQSWALGDRTNMAYMGTVVSYGHGLGLVTATGMATELGQIARSLQTVRPEPTPLQSRLAQFGRTLAILAIAIVCAMFLLGLARGESPRLMLLTSLSMAVAVVPEGLPAVATVALAIGASRMLHKQALIRKLPAVETLGSVTVICSDKTGTLTQNRMTVTVLDLLDQQIDFSATHQAQPEGTEPCPETLEWLLVCGALCNDAELKRAATSGSSNNLPEAVGDPTEGALVVAAARLGLNKDELEQSMPRTSEVPFDSLRKRMTTVHQLQPGNVQSNPVITKALAQISVAGDGHIMFTKGAVDSLLNVCRYVWRNGSIQTLTDPLRLEIAAANENLAAQGIRVLGFAMRPLDHHPTETSSESLEQELIFLGLAGMVDPPREEVAAAVEKCRAAGIRPIMITGDHPLTASHIAQQLDISRNDKVLIGAQLEKMTDDALQDAIQDVNVFARVTPNDKLRLIQLLQNNNHIVAMTGDGVNDAPALKQAHIGVAMGITGTDVSKEAAQMVLLDDNFATIVNAVEQGRISYDNIRKFVKYTMTSNAGEIWVMILGPMLGMPLPLLPLQILWINLVTDGLPGLALATEKAERDTMKRPPYPPQESIFGRGMGRDIAWIGLLMGIVSLAMGYWVWSNGAASDSHWRTLVFTTLTFAQMGNALATRSSHDSLFRIGVFTNGILLGSIALTVGLQLLVIYWAPLQHLFKTVPISAGELVLCVLISSIVFWAIEAWKMLARVPETGQ